MGRMVAWIDRKLYSQFRDNWDDSLFRTQISEILKKEDHLLDLGAGAGVVPQMNFRGLAARVCGVDPDERVQANPYLDEGKVGFGESIPYKDGEFDVVIADNVLEHLERSEQVFKEIARG